MPESETQPMIVLEREDDIVTLTFNDPDRRNAMTAAMGEAFAERDRRSLAADDSLRAVVLTGRGRAFSAGGDLGMIQERADEARARPGLGRRGVREFMRSFYKLFLSVRELPCPSIAADQRPRHRGRALCRPGLRHPLRGRGRPPGPQLHEAGPPPRHGGHVDPAAPGGPRAGRRAALHQPASWTAGRRRASAWPAAPSRLPTCCRPPVLHGGRDRRLRAHRGAGRQAGTGAHRERASLEDQLSFEAWEQSICFESDDVEEGIAAARERREPDFHGH